MREMTVGIVNYNGAEVLPDTMTALEQVVSSQTELLLVDDGSDDGSPEWVERHYPRVRVERMGTNTGRLNRVRNVVLREANHRLVFLMDNDISPTEGCLERLADVLLARDARVLACTPRLVYHDAPDRIYQDGGGLHYLCVSTAGARGDPVADHPPRPPHPTLGGGVMLIDRQAWRSMGGFDEAYLRGWGDDGEFQLRGRLRGWEVLHVSDAVCGHVARPHGPERMTAQIYNRYRTLATAYSARSLILLAPPLLVFELALTVLAVFGGFAGTRFRGLGRALSERSEILRRRRDIQRARRVRDGRILEGGSLMHPDAAGRSRLVRVGTRLLASALEAYWKLVRRWI